MSITAAIRQMIAAGLSVEQALTAAEIMEANLPVHEDGLAMRRANDAERQRRHRERRDCNVMSRDKRDSVTSCEQVSPLVPPFDKEIPPTPPKEINTPPIIPPSDCTGQGASDWPANAEVIDTIIAQSGLRLTNAETWHLRSAGVVALWRHNGFSFWDEVLPTIKALVDGGAKVKSWAYFTDAIAQCRADRQKPIPIPEPRQPNERRNPDNRDQSAGRPTDYMREAIDIDQQRRGAQLDRASGF